MSLIKAVVQHHLEGIMLTLGGSVLNQMETSPTAPPIFPPNMASVEIPTSHGGVCPETGILTLSVKPYSCTLVWASSFLFEISSLPVAWISTMIDSPALIPPPQTLRQGGAKLRWSIIETIHLGMANFDLAQGAIIQKITQVHPWTNVIVLQYSTCSSNWTLQLQHFEMLRNYLEEELHLPTLMVSYLSIKALKGAEGSDLLGLGTSQIRISLLFTDSCSLAPFGYPVSNFSHVLKYLCCILSFMDEERKNETSGKWL